MSKFDLMAGNDAIEIQVMGSTKMLQSILDQEIKMGHGAKDVMVKIGMILYGVDNVAQTQIDGQEYATIIWVTPSIGSCSIFYMRDQLEFVTPKAKVAIVLKSAIRGKYEYEDIKFKLMGCKISSIETHSDGIRISAEGMSKFTGIKSFIKELDSLEKK